MYFVYNNFIYLQNQFVNILYNSLFMTIFSITSSALQRYSVTDYLGGRLRSKNFLHEAQQLRSQPNVQL